MNVVLTKKGQRVLDAYKDRWVNARCPACRRLYTYGRHESPAVCWQGHSAVPVEPR